MPAILNAAESYANELLAGAPSYPKDWNYGNAIFSGNMLLGRVALRRDKRAKNPFGVEGVVLRRRTERR
jgi:hypothetical protein